MTCDDTPCPTCSNVICTYFLDCPCGEETTTGCANCDLVPSGSARGGWAHREHLNADLFTMAGVVV